ITIPAQYRGRKLAHRVLVFHQQHGLTLRTRRLLYAFGPGVHLLEDSREKYGKLGALAKSALYANKSSALTDHTVDRCQAKTSALAGLLGGVERFEDVIACFRSNPAARVRDGQHHIIAHRNRALDDASHCILIDVFRFYRQPASERHRVTG